MGSSCFQRGSKRNLEFIEAWLEMHGCAATVELFGSRCEEACRKGPVLEINGRPYHEVNLEVLAHLMEQQIGKKPDEPLADVPDRSLTSRHQQGKGLGK
jgi:NADH:ubiquinone oxidoreductase subunit E